MSCTPLVIIFLFAKLAAPTPPFFCGQKTTQKKPYGIVEIRVDCKYLTEYDIISVTEHKKKIRHGTSMHFDGQWRKRDSSFFRNGKEEGQCLVWDSVGNVSGRYNFRHGKRVGKYETYFSPGHPHEIKNYNSAGKEDGPLQEWWENGNKKTELTAKNGQIISGTEYYPNGKPRVTYTNKYEPKRSVFKTKYVQAESWAPNGRPAGKVSNGNGEWLIFPAEPRETFFIHREIYKDSLMVKLDELDSAQVEKWLSNPPGIP